MRDYWLTQYILSGIGGAYLVASTVVLVLAIRLPKSNRNKAIAFVVALAAVSFWPLQGVSHYLEQRKLAEEGAARYAKARALFDERCRTAGEKIYRTVEDVDGIVLLTIRSGGESPEDRNMRGAAAAHELTGDDFIRAFLQPINSQSTDTGRYRYVDVVSAADGERVRYHLDLSGKLAHEHTKAARPPYALSFEDTVDPLEREAWVAGSMVKIVDLEKNEVLGEFVRYVIDPGQGSRAGHRVPWLFARGCNMQHGYGYESTQNFAFKVLKPKRGSK